MEGGRLEAQKRRWKIGLNDWIGFLSILSGGELSRGRVK